MQKFTRSSIWMGDCLQVAFRMTPPVPFQLPDYDYGFALTPEGVQVYRWISPDRDKDAGELVSSIKTVIKRENGITIYEIAIPQSELKPLQLKEGKIFGFNFVVLDVDEGKPAGFHWIGLTPGIAGGKDASVFRNFLFLRKADSQP